MSTAPYRLSDFDEELDALRAGVCEMGGRVEAAIAEAAAALADGDVERAARVLAHDDKVDALVAEVERAALDLVRAGDPREVLAAFKIAGLLARMGDCAVNVARRVDPDAGRLGQSAGLAAMAREVGAMVKAALDAYVRRDGAAAPGIAAMDEAVDRRRACIAHALIEHMAEDPRGIAAATHLMFAANKLERIADHAVGIADIVRFAAGETI